MATRGLRGREEEGRWVAERPTGGPGRPRKGTAGGRVPACEGRPRAGDVRGTVGNGGWLTGAIPDGDALSFTASSSARQVVTASVTGAFVTLAVASEGAATIRVTATDPGGLNAAQPFTVTVEVSASVPFTDHPIRPGVTPVKAIHFTELRERIDALRRAVGLPAFSWTDAVLEGRGDAGQARASAGAPGGAG